MSIAHIQEIEQKWYGKQPQGAFVAAVHAALDGITFTDAYVDQLICETPTRLSKSKVIKDNVWAVDSQTLKLLDCPIMQKLRGIHQLGLSFLVYPSAEHSRFPHSLGVYYVTSRYVEEINKHVPGSSEEIEEGLEYDSISETQAKDVVHAALLHDIGHLPFSHATESIFGADATRFRFGPDSVSEFMLPVKRKCGNVQLSECLSLAVVLSPRFKRFYSNVVRPGDSEAPIRIAGQRLSPENRVLTDLISDKIDYLCRDAESCNIPLGIDAARLFLRSACIIECLSEKSQRA